MSNNSENRQPASGTYDLAVIGAGSAGFSAAITASEQGARVALIGFGTIGGTCVNVGCVPSKTLIRAMEGVHHANIAPRFDGVIAEGRLADWSALRKQKDQLVLDLRKAKYEDLLPSYDLIDYIEGKAKIIAGNVVVGEKIVVADKIVIATGSHEYIPDIEGLNQIDWLNSTSAFELDELPDSMMIMGAGYIGCELAQLFSRAGVKITLLYRSRLLPQMEPEIGSALGEYLNEGGIELIKLDNYQRVRNAKNMVIIDATIDGNIQTISAQKLLLSAGRQANIAGLGLRKAGIKLHSNNGIEVDAQMRTSAKNIYAAGDVTGRDQFVYMAAYGAKIAAKNALGDSSLSYDNSAMPAVVFTDPQVASVGLTEQAASEAGYDVKTTILTLDNVPRALTARNTRGLIKLVADRKSKKLLGAHILAPEGADAIQTAALAIAKNMTYDELGAMIFPYLTTVEGLKLAAQTFDMDVKKLSCCAG